MMIAFGLFAKAARGHANTRREVPRIPENRKTTVHALLGSPRSCPRSALSGSLGVPERH
jgi:hypothetical protein